VGLMTTDNAMFVTSNRTDAGTITTGSELVGLPAENLKDRQRTKIWRTAVTTAPTQTPTTLRDTTAARTWLEIDLGQAYLLNVVALLSNNISQTGKWRVRIATASDFNSGSIVYDSGQVAAWPVIGGFGTLDWGVFNWGDILTTIELSYYKIDSLVIFPSSVVGQYVRIDIIDATNPDTYIQAGRLVIGPCWQPSVNFDLGWQIGWQDDSVVSRTMGGQIYVDERPRYRVARLTLGQLSETEMYAYAFDNIDRRKGISGDILFIPQPGKPALYLQEVLYGRMRSLSPMTQSQLGDVRSKEFEIEELL
jgi:hypothetical protein